MANYFKKSLTELSGVQAPPKRPLSPYFRFIKHMRPQIVKENPNASVTEIIKLVAEKWHAVDPGLKSRFEAEYKVDKESFDKQYDAYNSKITPEMREKVREARKELKTDREKRDLRRRYRELEKPKKVASAFLRFMQSEVVGKKGSGRAEYSQYLKDMGARWKVLSDEEKRPYKEAYERDLPQYKADLEKWQVKMTAEKNFDVVKNPLIVQTQRAPRQKTSKSSE